MTPPIVLGVFLIALAYGMSRAARKWGAAVLWFFAAGVSFLGGSGVLAERLWGPRWSWNLAHHGSAYAEGALFQGILYLCLGLYFRSAFRQRSAG